MNEQPLNRSTYLVAPRHRASYHFRPNLNKIGRGRIFGYDYERAVWSSAPLPKGGVIERHTVARLAIVRRVCVYYIILARILSRHAVVKVSEFDRHINWQLVKP